MSFLIALLFAGGVGAWVYNKVQRRNGGLTQQSLMAAAAVAVVALIIFYSLYITFVPHD